MFMFRVCLSCNAMYFVGLAHMTLIFGFFSMALKVNYIAVHLLLASHNDYVLQNGTKNVVM